MVVFFFPEDAHHLNAAIENFLAGHDELGFAAAEECREHRAEAAIHRVERGLQQRPRFTVYAADRVLEGLHGSAEVGRLGVENCLRSWLVVSSSRAAMLIARALRSHW